MIHRVPHHIALTLLAVIGLCLTAVAEEGWLVDFAKAKAQSAKEGKPILMEFTKLKQPGALISWRCGRFCAPAKSPKLFDLGCW